MSNYPLSFDYPENLFTVYDSLKAPLGRDWNPGDSTVFADEDVSRFPPTGIITLIDQCSAYEDRAVSLKYSARSANSFSGCEPAEGTNLVYKPKKLTKIVMQVRAEHHNILAKAIMSIESFLGTKKAEDQSLFGRLNRLQKLMYAPKAWFEVDNTTGLVPFTVTFRSDSQGVKGPVGEVTYEWDFGDGTTTLGPEHEVTKTYTESGVFDVTLTVYNLYGEDKITLTSLIKSKIEAPDEAIIKFTPQFGQILSPDELHIRTPVNQFVTLEIPGGEAKPGLSYAGEYLDSNKRPLDPVTHYTWSLGDDLLHNNTLATKAVYSLGGVYDLVIRVDTLLGSYRITNYENCIDVVEDTNLWLWNVNNKNINAYEFGLGSETFKIKQSATQQINFNDSFLNNVPNSAKQKQEFRKNNGFAAKTATSSGNQGTCMLFWASGRDEKSPQNTEKISFLEYNAFTDTYYSHHPSIDRPWNWASLISPANIYFILGACEKSAPTMSPTNQVRTDVDLMTMETLNYPNNGYTYVNGAQEVAYNPSDYDDNGDSIHGHYSVYRTAWKDQTGYLMRNDNVGDNFMLRNFYKTSGTIGAPFVSLMKLTDAPVGRKEGSLVSLSSGVFFFSNDSTSYVYKPDSATWEVSPTNPAAFRSLQDNKKLGFDSPENTLFVVSDGDRKAYLSFDYSHNAFMRFNEADLTFSSVGARPAGEQWLMGVF